MTRADLLRADEVLLTSSVAGILPVRRIDGQPVGRDAAGPLTIQLRDRREAWIDHASRGRT